MSSLQRFICLCILLLSFSNTYAQNLLLSPDEFLPYKLGEKFTPHHLLVDYFQHVAENSDQVIFQQYGMTNDDRPLIYTIISTKENLANIENIRKQNLARTGMISGDYKNQEIAIVWLSYGVHGNEAGASEASLATIYELVNPQNKEIQDWLKNTVIILDPCINPDGYSRYTSWNRDVMNKTPNANPMAREHDEPWPGGRINHYLFDLNRDWAWQTQIESSQRMKVYHSWMPHVHVDFHEQHYNSNYYFAPAAQPYHQHLTDWQGEFQMEIGKNHARYFDEEGWLYFTREVFDLFYPSYGDTYPMFNGAIGMTYEQAGHSRAGVNIVMNNEDTLKLSDRIEHHLTTGLSTVELSSKKAKALCDNFQEYFDDARKNPKGEFDTYIIKGNNNQNKIKALCDLLDKNAIKYGSVKKAGLTLDAFDYSNGKQKSISLANNDLVISAHQPMSVLTQVLFEPKSELVDSLTYDITAWSLPYAYGLDAYAVKQDIQPDIDFEYQSYSNNLNSIKRPYSYLVPWNDLEDARFLGDLLQQNIKVRFSQVAFEIDNRKFAPGTLVITRADNKPFGDDLKTMMTKTAQKYQQEIHAVKTGFVTSGSDFGSSNLSLIDRPNILIASGEGSSALVFGQVWHYFENDLNYNMTIVDADNIVNRNLDDFNLLILPEGRYSFSEDEGNELNEWVRAGGRIIAMGSAIYSLPDGFDLKRKSRSTSSSDKDAIKTYGGQERKSISGAVPGAIYKVKMDTSHPLAFGFSDHYFTLKTSSRSFEIQKNVWNVGYIEKDPMVIGFVGSKAKAQLEETIVFGVQDVGRGSVTFMVDNPLFRGFWEEGKFLFSNAIFMVGQ